MNGARTYVILGSAASVAALAAWYMARRASGADDSEPLVAASDGVLEFITVTANRIAASTVNAGPDAPRGIRNNNPGNLSWLATNAYNGQIGRDGALAIYDTPQNGLRAMALELKNDYQRKGFKTIDALITEWAPPHDNPTVAYINAVSRALSFPPSIDLPLNRVTWAKLVRAIIRQENANQDPYSDELLNAALSGAGFA